MNGFEARRPRPVLPVMALIVISAIMAIAFQAEPPRNGTPWPNVVLAIVFFWVIHRPAAIPLGLVFAIGLFRDMATGEIIGAGLAVLILGVIVLRSTTDGLSNTPFAVRWAAFSAFACLAIATEFLLTALAKLAFPPAGPVVWHVLATVLIYPLISIFYTRVLRIGRSRTNDQAA